ncbi:MAG: MFS transporter [Patescibacteria group bacterium]|nr:MFS transporter [Patescibacteria group bacterium]
MFKIFNYNPSHFFARRLKRPMRELYLSVAIMDFATAAVTIFEPIYFYTIGYSVAKILLFYLGMYALYFAIMPLGAKYANARGYEKSILISTFFLIAFYLCLYALPLVPWLIYFAAAAIALQKMFYWPGYHANFASFSDESEQAREISTLKVINDLVYVLGPLIGGLIITLASFNTLFIVVIVLIMVSNLPFLLTEERVTPKPFSYGDAYKKLIHPKRRRRLFAYMGFGEELVVMVIWPIFIYLIIKSYWKIGSVIALATLVTALVTLFVGRICDKHHKHPVIKLGSILYLISWWLRYLASSTGLIFLADTLSRISKNMIYVPVIAITYLKARRHDIMNRVLFLEMALVVGKVLALISIILVIQFFGLSAGFVFAFLLAGAMSLLYNFL